MNLYLKMSISRRLALAWCGTAALALAASAQANLVSNGGFETTSTGGGQLGYNTTAAGWSTTGYNFVFPAGTADAPGVAGSLGLVQLWGPNNGSANGLTATSPDGGNYLAASADYNVGAISQTITGLTVGDVYHLTFDYAAAQQQGFFGDTTVKWSVTLGDQTLDTDLLANPSLGFTGWREATLDYTATSTTETLSFLASGSLPVLPFALLDGVDLEPAVTPEPSTMALAALGLGGMVAARRRALAK